MVFCIVDDKNIPIFSESPLCVARKLEWNPLQPITPPPRSTKLEGLLWKNDCLTRRQPLQAKRNRYKRKLLATSSILQKFAFWIVCNNYVLLRWVLSQNNINHPNCFLGMLRFLTSQGMSNSIHRNLCSKRQLNFICLRVVRSSDSFPVTSRWTIIARAAVCRSPESKKVKLTLKNNHQSIRQGQMNQNRRGITFRLKCLPPQQWTRY